jgi:hypothetical protein
MPIQGSLRDLSVIETLQLVGNQRKTVSLRLATEEDEVVLHFREGLLTSIRAIQGGRREPFLDALVALGHISPSEALPLSAQVWEEGRDPWIVACEVPHLERGTCERVFLGVTEALLDRILLWDRGHFAMLPPASAEAVFRPGLAMDNILLDAMRRLDELAAWKQGDFPASAIPFLASGGDLVVSSDPLRRAVLRQVDGRRSIREIVEATRLGEHETYATIADGVQGGSIHLLSRPVAAAPQAPTREILRRSPALAVLLLILLLVATSSWVDKRLSIDQGPWHEARARWEEIDLRRLIEVHRYRTGSYPRELGGMERSGVDIPRSMTERWFYQMDGASYRLIPR